MKRDAVDVEHICGAALVSPTFLENAEDVGALDIVQTFAGDGEGRLRLKNKILLAKFWLLRHNHGAFDGIFQFAHIAHPRLLL